MCKFNSLYSPQRIYGQNHEYDTLPRQVRIEKSCENNWNLKTIGFKEYIVFSPTSVFWMCTHSLFQNQRFLVHQTNNLHKPWFSSVVRTSNHPNQREEGIFKASLGAIRLTNYAATHFQLISFSRWNINDFYDMYWMLGAFSSFQLLIIFIMLKVSKFQNQIFLFSFAPKVKEITFWFLP